MIPVDMSSWLNGFMGPTFQDRLGKPVLLRGYIQKQNCMMVICFSVVTVLTFIDHIPLFLRYFFHSIGHWLLTTSTWVTVCFIPRNWMMIDSMSFRVADPRAPRTTCNSQDTSKLAVIWLLSGFYWRYVGLFPPGPCTILYVYMFIQGIRAWINSISFIGPIGSMHRHVWKVIKSHHFDVFPRRRTRCWPIPMCVC